MLHHARIPTSRPRLSAVTGTNGKTTVATATLQLMRAAGWRPAGYDSTGVTDVNGELHPSRVRKSPDYLPELLEAQVALGAEAFSLEAFVGILADGLLDRIEVDVAICTGLERDHLDVHGSIEAYWAAKLKLFDTYLTPDGVAVLATDCAQGDRVRDAVARRGARLMTVGEGGDLRFEHRDRDQGRLVGELVIDGCRYAATMPTVHDIAVTNLLLAATGVLALGAPPETVADALGEIQLPPGRLEVVAEQGGVTAMVDTAHNPGALRTALDAVRSSTEGRVLLVFGAGGERERPKRAEMGAIAADRADLVVLTDDNPRREPPDRIRAEVRVGCPDCIEIPRRRDAILAALEMARPGDTVLVAGKGDETTQLVGRTRVPHDDREVIRSAVAPRA